MAAAGVQQRPVLVSVIVLLVVLVTTQLCSSHAMSGSASSRRNLLGSSNNLQRNSNQIPNCNDMSSASLCSQNPKCRWCRSDALDDMCFSKSEALRLPDQVFSCG